MHTSKLLYRGLCQESEAEKKQKQSKIFICHLLLTLQQSFPHTHQKKTRKRCKRLTKLTRVQMHLVWNTWEKTQSMKQDSGSALSSEFFAWSCDGKENVTSWLIAWLTNTTKAPIKTTIWNQNMVKVKYKHKRRRTKWTCTWKRNQRIIFFGTIYNSSCRKCDLNKHNQSPHKNNYLEPKRGQSINTKGEEQNGLAHENQTKQFLVASITVPAENHKSLNYDAACKKIKIKKWQRFIPYIWKRVFYYSPAILKLFLAVPPNKPQCMVLYFASHTLNM